MTEQQAVAENKYRMVLVRWVDVTKFSIGWVDRENAKDFFPMQIASLGWLVDEAPDHITLSPQITLEEGDDRCTDLCVIPRGCITSMLEIPELGESRFSGSVPEGTPATQGPRHVGASAI